MARQLVISSLPDKKRHRWIDRDTILLHAAFQVLVDFVEQEKPQEMFTFAGYAWTGEPVTEADQAIEPSWEESVWDWQQIFGLYHWWKARDSRYDPCADNPGPWPEAVLELPLPKWLQRRCEVRILRDLKGRDRKLWYDECYTQEDTDKLKELADLRCYLWT